MENLYTIASDYAKFLIGKLFEQKSFSRIKDQLKQFFSDHVDAHCSLGVDILNVNSCYTLTNKDEFLMGKVQEDNVFEKKKFTNVQRLINQDKKNH